MAQVVPRFCPRCGAATAGHQGFCFKCGLDLTGRAVQAAQPPLVLQATQPSPAPQVQPLNGQAVSQPHYPQQRPPQAAVQPVQGYQQPPLQPFQVAQPNYTPAVAAPIKASKKKSGGLFKWVVFAMLGLIILAAAGYGSLFLINKVRQPAITTQSLQAVGSYAGVAITIVKVEQSESFSDNPNTSNNGMIRIHLQEKNSTNKQIYLRYNKIAHLVGDGGKALAPNYVQSDGSIAAGATQTSMLDFATKQPIERLTLLLGTDDEVQSVIALSGKSGQKLYTPGKTAIQGELFYQQLDWSLVSASTQLAIDGQQAKKGMHFITIEIKVANSMSQTAIPGSAYDYMRLQVGSLSAKPVATTMPVSYAAGTSGKTGTVTFLIPQNQKTLTFVLVAQPKKGFNEATAQFQI